MTNRFLRFILLYKNSTKNKNVLWGVKTWQTPKVLITQSNTMKSVAPNDMTENVPVNCLKDFTGLAKPGK